MMRLVFIHSYTVLASFITALDASFCRPAFPRISDAELQGTLDAPNALATMVGARGKGRVVWRGGSNSAAKASIESFCGKMSSKIRVAVLG